MAHEYLGAEFDIHCGGMDLVFPHHENEIAQARAAGDGFARYWLHNGWVTMGGEKMSKSLGNVLAIPAVLQRVRPAELRYYLGSAHYRSMLEFTETALQDAATGLHRYRGVPAPGPHPGRGGVADHLDRAFGAALDDDLAVPAALAEVHAARADGNRALEAGDHDTALAKAGEIRSHDGHSRLRSRSTSAGRPATRRLRRWAPSTFWCDAELQRRDEARRPARLGARPTRSATG